MAAMLRTIATFLRSVTLTLGILGLLVIGFAGATILGGDFFHSPWFYALAAAFTVNLGACTAHRLRSQLRKKGRRNHGPDVLHLGLLVVIAAVVFGQASRWETSFWLSKGDGVGLPDGRTLILRDLGRDLYPDGRPKAYRSTVDLVGGPASKVQSSGPSSATIEVNRPLRLKGLSIYQQGYATRPAVLFAGPGERLVRVFGGGEADLPGLGRLAYLGDRGEGQARSGVFTLTGADGTIRNLDLAAGDLLEGWRVDGFADLEATGLMASSDPAWPFTLAGFLIVALGLLLTYARKLKETT